MDSNSTKKYGCGNCGRAFDARPIYCECGARFADGGEDLIVVKSDSHGGRIGFDASVIAFDDGGDD